MLLDIKSWKCQLFVTYCVPDRSGASTGVWLVVLVPLACLPGLYNTYRHCHPLPHLQALLAIQVTDSLNYLSTCRF